MLSTIVSLEHCLSSILHLCLTVHLSPNTHSLFSSLCLYLCLLHVFTLDSKEPEVLFHSLFPLSSFSPPSVSLGGCHVIKESQLLVSCIVLRDQLSTEETESADLICCTVIFNQSLTVVVYMQITCVPSWTVSIQQ